MTRPSDSNECHRCPGHGSIRVDGLVVLKLCRRCWLEWQGSAVRGAVQHYLATFLTTGHLEAAPQAPPEGED